MAYNHRYNPDALPMHAEPEQAAALLSSQQSQHSSKPLPPRSDSYNRPPPSSTPNPALHPRDSHYNRNSPQHTPNQSYTGAPPPPRQQAGDRYGYSSPPPQNYGYGGAPPSNLNGGHGRPPLSQSARPPPTPAPPRDSNDREAMWRLFGAVDKDRSGHLTERELGSALVNGDYTQFDPHTVKMMIRMFDTDRNGKINFEEFCGLWGFLAAWRNLFDRFDRDRSGNISYPEFSDALVAFGYRLSPAFVSLLFRTYDKRNENAISFDLFVQACISLKRMTDVFKKYDEDRDGYITLSFEEFLTEILKQR